MKKALLCAAVSLLFISCVAAEDMPGLPSGVQAPDFEATTYEGKTVRLSDKLKEGPVVLIFYRGGWCPYCIRHLRDLQSRLEEFKARGASLIAISVDLMDNSQETVETNELGFTVVSNPTAELLELYDLITHVPDETVEKYVTYGIDLKRASGRDDHVIAVPAAYVVNTDGMIAYAYANLDYKVRAKPDDLLKALDGLSE